MALSNEIVLRPRFQWRISDSEKAIINTFETLKTTQSNYKVSVVDHHVFIRIPKYKQHFWSPQLHLEILKEDDHATLVKGLFGPNPAVWTMFMFMHFIVAGLFITFGIWAYSNYTLGEPFIVQLTLLVFMVISWFVLYMAGRLGKSRGKPEMQELYMFLQSTIGYSTS